MKTNLFWLLALLVAFVSNIAARGEEFVPMIGWEEQIYHSFVISSAVIQPFTFGSSSMMTAGSSTPNVANVFREPPPEAVGLLSKRPRPLRFCWEQCPL
jgi:hypothetical protein